MIVKLNEAPPLLHPTCTSSHVSLLFWTAFFFLLLLFRHIHVLLEKCCCHVSCSQATHHRAMCKWEKYYVSMRIRFAFPTMDAATIVSRGPQMETRVCAQCARVCASLITSSDIEIHFREKNEMRI